MTVELVKATMPKVWPGVRDGIARWIRTAGGKRPPNLNHRITEQALWELARLGLLVTPEQQAILEAAFAWYAVGPDSPDEEYDKVDRELQAAVQNCQRVAA